MAQLCYSLAGKHAKYSLLIVIIGLGEQTSTAQKYRRHWSNVRGVDGPRNAGCLSFERPIFPSQSSAVGEIVSVAKGVLIPRKADRNKIGVAALNE